MCKVSLKMSNEADLTLRLRAIKRTFFSSHQYISIALCMALSVRASQLCIVRRGTFLPSK